jgi:VanZ family protein
VRHMTNTLYKAILLLSLVLIPVITLSPFDFTIKWDAVNWKVFALSPGIEQRWEIVSNTLLYFPVGFGLTGCFFRQFKKLKVVVSILVICFTVSYFFEFLQSYLPSRFPSWRDVASNTLGGILGSLCIFVWETMLRNVSLRFPCGPLQKR